jgi:DNA gyrase/topoisomerase IV subunit A
MLTLNSGYEAKVAQEAIEEDRVRRLSEVEEKMAANTAAELEAYAEVARLNRELRAAKERLRGIEDEFTELAKQQDQLL